MPPNQDTQGKIYSATYSNVPVYELNVEGNHVMRRRSDDWINATHILKVADYDKPARTRILEREVQKGVHEKVQGGYGKYQGTWIPLVDGRHLAERNGVLEKLLPIFDFVPGDRSPPPAPKHATAASRPRAPRNTAPRRVAVPSVSQISASEEHYERTSAQFNEDETPDNGSIATEPNLEDPEGFHNSQYTGSRKRKRDQMSLEDQQHQWWGDSLLDYFCLLDSEDRLPAPPEPPVNIDLDRPIDDKGHSAMHWAAAMGDVDVVKDLIRRGARIDCLSNSLETPLMRAVMFTNNYDKQTMPSMIKILQPTVSHTDWFGSTVFHHIAATTSSKNKYHCARYYMDVIINKLSETWVPQEVTRLLDAHDKNGDTALMIAARNGARKCVRSLLGRGVGVDIPNNKGETADDLIQELNARRRERIRQASSSPFAPDRPVNGGTESALAIASSSSALHASLQAASAHRYSSQTAHTLMQKIAPTLLDKCAALAAAYETELDEKEAEAAEAERVVKKREAEIDALRKQMSELATLPEATQSVEQDRLWEEELQRLQDEAERNVEVEQRSELAELVEKAKARDREVLADNLEPAIFADNASAQLVGLRLAAMLVRAQKKRKALVKQVVKDLSVAGMGEKQKEYKRLLCGALGVRDEDIESVLPEILGQLEEERESIRLEGASTGPEVMSRA